jgi:hypothetical protein
MVTYGPTESSWASSSVYPIVPIMEGEKRENDCAHVLYSLA